MKALNITYREFMEDFNMRALNITTEGKKLVIEMKGRKLAVYPSSPYNLYSHEGGKWQRISAPAYYHKCPLMGNTWVGVIFEALQNRIKFNRLANSGDALGKRQITNDQLDWALAGAIAVNSKRKMNVLLAERSLRIRNRQSEIAEYEISY
tara:strand:+ start:1130 stop:1582 length:453 start_codon:yes stop_codon:yes gene_type:complete